MPTGSSELSVRIVHHDSRTLVAVAGELDLSTKSVLQSHLDHVIIDAPGDIELDLAGVTYIDSSCLSEIVAACTTLLDQGRELVVTEAGSQVARMFELGGITHLLDHSATRPARSSRVASPASPPGDASTRPVPTPTLGRVAVNPLVR